jgi:hypothetical protein
VDTFLHVTKSFSGHAVFGQHVSCGHDWLRERHIHACLLGVTYRKGDWYPIAIARRKDARATFKRFKFLEEDSHARTIKAELNMGDLEFVTIPRPSPDGSF